MSAWWDQQMMGWIGGVGGSLLGVLGGVYGTLAGILPPRGKGRGFMLGAAAVMLAVGVVLLVAGCVAVAAGQPYHVWYPLVLGGGSFSFVMASVFVAVHMRYREAERRKMAAAEIRRG